MTDRRGVLVGAFGAGISLSFPSLLQAADKGGRFLEYSKIRAEGLPEQRLTIWLPPGYDAGRSPHRVLYMHDAQNLFDPALSNFNKVWAADRAMIGHAEKRGEDPWIIVGIWSPGVDRYRQYMPQPAYERASPFLRGKMDEYAQGPLISRAYIDWLAYVVKPWVDRHFRTRTGPLDTAMIGSSMGGLISLYAFLQHPGAFGRAGCVSTHWPGIAPQSVEGLDQEMRDIWRKFIIARLGTPAGRRLWFDHGTATLDRYYAAYQGTIDTTMRNSGWERGTHWESRVYPGAEHEENAWASRLPEIFNWVLG